MLDDKYYTATARKSVRRGKWEDTGGQVFCKYILNLVVGDILDTRSQQLSALPKALSSCDDLDTYYQNFLPLILEETRAILAQGLDAESKNRVRSFDIKIKSINIKNVKHPVNLELEGKVPDDTDVGTAVVVLKLTCINSGISILCLADFREHDQISAKIMHRYIENNPDDFDKKSKWKACVLGSILSQKRMYEACYNPQKPNFIQKVITGCLPYTNQKISSDLPDLSTLQLQAIQAFGELDPSSAQTIKVFSSLDSSEQNLFPRFFALDFAEQQVVTSFISLASLEQHFVYKFFLLNLAEQGTIKLFSKFNFSRQQIVKSFAELNVAEKKVLGCVLAALDAETIRYFVSLGYSEQRDIKKFFQLSAQEQEVIRGFCLLEATGQDEIRKFYALYVSLQEVVQNSTSIMSSIYKFFSGKTGYESEISRLSSLLESLRQQFIPRQQQVVDLFFKLDSAKQQVSQAYFSVDLPNHKAILRCCQLSDVQYTELKSFYDLYEFSQRAAIIPFLVLDSSPKKDINDFVELDPSIQENIRFFYGLEEGNQQIISSFFDLESSYQKIVNCFYLLNFPIQKAIQTFATFTMAEKETIEFFLSLDISAQQAIKYFASLSLLKQLVFKGFYALNRPQQVAIRDFYELEHGIQLLQGPPGTGKTTMIVELLNALCAQRKRILVCAPSNKAVQIIAERFLEKYPIYRLVLVGVEQKLKESLRPIFIHTWADDLCEIIDACIEKITNHIKYKKKLHLAEVILQIQQMIKTIQHSTRLFGDILYELNQAILPTDADNQLLKILAQLLALRNKIYEATEYDQKQSGSKLEIELLNCAHVIFATLSTTGRRIFTSIVSPDVLIIDETSQAVEAETLIPFALQPTKCLLVGDTKQLPATVISQIATQYNYHWSMMWRLLEECKQRCNMLTVQYRMHPSIRQWPSQQYYNNLLKDAPLIFQRPPSVSQYGAYAFINVVSEECFSDYSCYNPGECKQVVLLLQELANKGVDINIQVGIITFYAAQVNYMRREFSKFPELRSLQVHTVDSYQGNESDYIIISFVRSNQRGTIGFLHDFRRLNVAITRARLALLMVGNSFTLERDRQQDVAQLVQDARARNCAFTPRQKITPIDTAVQKKSVDSHARFFKEAPKVVSRDLSTVERPVDTKQQTSTPPPRLTIIRRAEIDKAIQDNIVAKSPTPK